ncbi:MAG TPA: hypothetical protein VN809_03230 [Telmatospirillum sp.]|nr:hypothetical protein [Telmatospirillum sp.]
MASRPHKTTAFLSANPVFTREAFAAALGHPPDAATVTSLLGHHLRAGNIKRVSRGVFAAVPPHLKAQGFMVDRFAAAAKLRPDGVLGYHSALELHGIAYSEFNQVQLISVGRTEQVVLPFGACRFINPPKALVDAGKVDILTTTKDRLGQMIRVTAIERTVVDVLHRFDITGGIEEVLPSLDLVQYLDPAKVIEYVTVLKSRTVASVVGWWLDSHRSTLGITDNELEGLRALLPRSKHYALGAKPGNAVMIEPWRVLLPARVLDQSFEGL